MIYPLITCVNFSDMLDVSLAFNCNIFQNITIITTTSDFETEKISHKYGNVTLIKSDKCHDNGSVFNKGKLLNNGLDSIYSRKQRNDWILLIDSDILVNPNINLLDLDKKKK